MPGALHPVVPSRDRLLDQNPPPSSTGFAFFKGVSQVIPLAASVDKALNKCIWFKADRRIRANVLTDRQRAERACFRPLLAL